MRPALLTVALLALAAVGIAPAPARGIPLLGLRPTGSPFDGPTDGADAAAIWWNPAALGQLSKLQFHFRGGGLLERGSIDRTAIRSDTGLPGDGADVRFPSQPWSSDRFHGLGALSFTYNDNITVAFAVLAPWLSCPAGGSCGHGVLGSGGSRDLPGAYHLASESFTTLFFSFAGALRIAPWLYFGVAVSIVDAFADLTFYRDTALDHGRGPQTACGGAPCNFEDPRAAQRVHVRGDGGLFGDGPPLNGPGLPKPSAVAVNLGVVLRPVERLWLGFSWQRVVPLGSGNLTLADTQRGEVDPAPADTTTPDCSGNICRGPSALLFAIPDVWQLGLRFTFSDEYELATWLRVVTYGGYGGATRDPVEHGLVVRLAGDAVSRGGAPTQMVFDYGLTPTLAGEIAFRWTPRPRLRLVISTATESAAVKPSLLSAAAFDGPKFDTTLGAEIRVASFFRLLVAAGGLVVVPVESSGGQDPNRTVACVRSGGALDPCHDVLEGRGLPSNAGRYSRYAFHFTLGFNLMF